MMASMVMMIYENCYDARHRIGGELGIADLIVSATELCPQLETSAELTPGGRALTLTWGVPAHRDIVCLPWISRETLYCRGS